MVNLIKPNSTTKIILPISPYAYIYLPHQSSLYPGLKGDSVIPPWLSPPPDSEINVQENLTTTTGFVYNGGPMSCNGCRVLRKGCKEDCMLRECLQWIDTPKSQGHATLFLAKFFGRAGLFSFISAVPLHQRPALFQSLLFEACGRTLNPVSGAVGLLGTGNWHMCQAAVETVLRGGVVEPMMEFLAGERPSGCDDGYETEVDFFRSRDVESSRSDGSDNDDVGRFRRSDLDLRLTAGCLQEKRRTTPTPSINSDESETMTFESCSDDGSVLGGKRKLLKLFI